MASNDKGIIGVLKFLDKLDHSRSRGSLIAVIINKLRGARRADRFYFKVASGILLRACLDRIAHFLTAVRVDDHNFHSKAIPF